MGNTMTLKIAQVIGLNTDQKAAQVASLQREDITFLGILDIECDDAFTKGRQILSELEDYYFESEGAAADKLNATFKEADNKIQSNENYSLCLAVIVGKVLYLIGKGQVETYLKRVNKLLPLLSVGSPSQLISGFVSAGDRLLFATHTLVTALGQDLEKSMDLPKESFEEEIGGKIGTTESEDKGFAALSVEVAEEAEEPLETVSKEEDAVEVKKDIYQEQQQEDLTYSKPTETPNPKMVLGKIKKLPGLLFKFIPQGKKARIILVLAVVLIAVILGAIKYKSDKDSKLQVQFNQIFKEAKDSLNEAKSLSSLNPAEAKLKLDMAKEKINKALGLKPKAKEAQDFKGQIEADSPSILKQAEVSSFPLFLDMDLVKKNFQASQLGLSQGKLLLLDPGTKTLVTVDISKKSNTILAGSEGLGDAQLASLNGGIAFVYSKNKGVLKVDINNSKISSVSKKDKSWGEIKDIYGFAGNVYMLDSSNNKIWKHLPTQEGYSEAREYFTKGTEADLSAAIKMQIDSSIYILKQGGEILRYTKGSKDHFALQGLDKGVNNPLSIFVSSDTDNFYILDSGNSRLLSLSKTGEFKTQMSGSKFATATDFVVDEIGKKVYLLEGGKIFQADLK